MQKLRPDFCGGCRFLDKSRIKKTRWYAPDVGWHEVDGYACILVHDVVQTGNEGCAMGIRIDD